MVTSNHKNRFLFNKKENKWKKLGFSTLDSVRSALMDLKAKQKAFISCFPELKPLVAAGYFKSCPIAIEQIAKLIKIVRDSQNDVNVWYC